MIQVITRLMNMYEDFRPSAGLSLLLWVILIVCQCAVFEKVVHGYWSTDQCPAH